MSSVANLIEFPVRQEFEERDSLGYDMVLALATADDLAAGMDAVVERSRRASGAASVEWWAEDDDNVPRLVASMGTPRGVRHTLTFERAGVFVFHGTWVGAQIESALASLVPIIRRRAAEERLARATVELARRNEALEDFAALVAHELKTPLETALVADDPSESVEDAILLVDALLEASRNGAGEETFTSVAECLEQAFEDLRVDVEITADLATTLPLPPGPLRVILRNLLANAVAAGAGHVHVTSVGSSFSWRLLVDDDGVGLAEVDRYAAGSGLGLALCRRIAARFGGAVELVARPSGGTRATLEITGALA
ncbi:MAG TPA: HAMP domain-containing sensor histidine kinase [Gaiellaceae bacterium]